jgi:hypothetical protein
MLWKSKLTEDQSAKKLILDITYSKKKLESTLFSTKTKTSMLLELPEVKELLELLKDSVLDINKKKPIEVTEESDVLEPGIHQELCGQLLELVNSVITTELN